MLKLQVTKPQATPPSKWPKMVIFGLKLAIFDVFRNLLAEGSNGHGLLVAEFPDQEVPHQCLAALISSSRAEGS